MTDHDSLCRQQHWDGRDCFDCRLIAKVRADERARTEMEEIGDVIHADRRRQRAALRAQVEALHVFNVDSGVDPYRYVIEPLVRRADVLALFDGGNDASRA